MKLIENMTLTELNAELNATQKELARINGKIELIHSEKDHSDEIAKSFHLGKVGFRKDTKRQSATLNKAIDRGVKATKLYEQRKHAESRTKALQRTISYVESNDISLTQSQIIEKKKNEIQDLDWVRENGGYKHGEWFIKKVDDLAFAYKNGEMRFHKKTVKEVKKMVAIAVRIGM